MKQRQNSAMMIGIILGAKERRKGPKAKTQPVNLDHRMMRSDFAVVE